MSIGLLIPLLLIITLVISILGSLSGVGGGVIFLPLFLIIFKSESFEHIKLLSTMLVMVSSLINTGINIYKKNFNYLVFLNVIALSIPSVFLGNYLNTLIDTRWIQLVVAILLLIVVGLLILQIFVKSTKNNVQKTIKNNWMYISLEEQKINWLILSSIIFGAGIITSLTGIGGGPLIMPALLIWLKLNMKDSVPISHSIIFTTSLITLITNYEILGNYEIDWVTAVLPALIGVVIGTITVIFIKKYLKNDIYIKWILIALIFISAIKMLVDFGISF